MYLLVDSSIYELPIGVFDSLREISIFYDIPYTTVRIACCKHRMLRSLGAYIVKVTLE